jgi:hypothetical protein
VTGQFEPHLPDPQDPASKPQDGVTQLGSEEPEELLIAEKEEKTFFTFLLSHLGQEICLSFPKTNSSNLREQIEQIYS